MRLKINAMRFKGIVVQFVKGRQGISELIVLLRNPLLLGS